MLYKPLKIAFCREIQLSDSFYEAGVESGQKGCKAEMIPCVVFPALQCASAISNCGGPKLSYFDPSLSSCSSLVTQLSDPIRTNLNRNFPRKGNRFRNLTSKEYLKSIDILFAACQQTNSLWTLPLPSQFTTYQSPHDKNSPGDEMAYKSKPHWQI